MPETLKPEAATGLRMEEFVPAAVLLTALGDSVMDRIKGVARELRDTQKISTCLAISLAMSQVLSAVALMDIELQSLGPNPPPPSKDVWWNVSVDEAFERARAATVATAPDALADATAQQAVAQEAPIAAPSPADGMTDAEIAQAAKAYGMPVVSQAADTDGILPMPAGSKLRSDFDAHFVRYFNAIEGSMRSLVDTGYDGRMTFSLALNAALEACAVTVLRVQQDPRHQDDIWTNFTRTALVNARHRLEALEKSGALREAEAIVRSGARTVH